MRVLKAKKKKMIEGREKPAWNDVGFTLLIGDWQGRTTYTLVDERTQERYSFFDLQRRDSAPAEPAEDYSSAPVSPDAEDVPF